MPSGIYLTENGIYRASEKLDGTSFVEVFKKDGFVPLKHATMDIFIMGMPISEKELKSIVSLANGDNSNIKKTGSLYQISDSIQLTIEEAKKKIE